MTDRSKASPARPGASRTSPLHGCSAQNPRPSTLNPRPVFPPARPYVAVFSARLRTLLQYRAAAIAGFVTQLFWGLIRTMIFTAFYASAPGSHPMTLEEVVTYIWLGQAFLTILPWNVEAELREAIRSGAVAYELLRPVDLWSLWFARSAAYRTAPAMLRALPVMLLAWLFFEMQPPASVAAGLACAASLLCAVLLAAALTTLCTITLLWTIAGEGISRFTFACVMLLSGLVIPLPLCPGWMTQVLDWLPFRGLVDVPFRLYLGHIPAAATGSFVAQQLAWTVAFALGGRLLLSRGLARMAIQGG